MWNYNYVFPSILILAIFLCYYFASPRLPIHMNTTFVILLSLEIAVVLSDLVACELDDNYLIHPAWSLWLWNMVFFVFFLARIYWFFLFTVDVLQLRPALFSPKAIAWGSMFALSQLITLSSVWTGAVFYIDEGGYHRGPLYQILYVCFFFYLVLTTLLLIQKRRELTHRAFFSLSGYNLILLAGNIVRILMPQYLVMNTFCLMSIVIIFLSFQNPTLFRTENDEAFNLPAFLALLRERLHHSQFRILGVTLKNYSDERAVYGARQMRQGIALISRYLVQTFPHTTVFYLRNGSFVLFGGEKMDWDEMRKTIHARFLHRWKADGADLYLDATFVQLDSHTPLGSADQIVNYLLTTFDEIGSRPDGGNELIELGSVEQIDRMVEVKRAMELAIERDQVEIHLQPLVDSVTRKPVAAEALARIRNSRGELISPGVFIPIAEKNGQIIRMGRQIFERTCQFIQNADLEQMGIGWINVNLSPIQCMNKELHQEFDEMLSAYHVSPEQIHLEITEQSVIDFSFLHSQMETLRQDGFQFVLDDYGSGYSNLTRVKRYPFAGIKLDMEVVWDYFYDRDELLPALVRTFKQMGYCITAEGIESEEMAQALTEIGCDLLQGFYFSKPLPLDSFVERFQPVQTLSMGSEG